MFTSLPRATCRYRCADDVAIHQHYSASFRATFDQLIDSLNKRTLHTYRPTCAFTRGSILGLFPDINNVDGITDCITHCTPFGMVHIERHSLLTWALGRLVYHDNRDVAMLNNLAVHHRQRLLQNLTVIVHTLLDIDDIDITGAPRYFQFIKRKGPRYRINPISHWERCIIQRGVRASLYASVLQDTHLIPFGQRSDITVWNENLAVWRRLNAARMFFCIWKHQMFTGDWEHAHALPGEVMQLLILCIEAPNQRLE